MKEVICLKCLPNSGRQSQSRMRSLFRPNLLKTGLFICIAVLSVTGMTWAQAGQLDTTFATKGIFLLNSIGQQGGSTRVALQTDGKIVLAAPSGDPQQSNNGIALVRLNTDGTPDASFGTAGVVVFGVDHTVPVGVAVQPDGKILVGSTSGQNVDGGGGFALARFNSNGSVDNAFGTGGHLDVVPFGTALSATLALQPDGKILMTGSDALARFDSNGQLDTSFGTGGVSVLPFFGAAAIALQSDGKILIASSSQVLDFNRDGIIVRFNPNGTLDKTFGLFGQISSVASGGVFGTAGAAVSSIVLQADGKFIVPGAITSKLINPPGSNHTGFGLIRYNRSGSIDTSFGTAGGILTNFGSNPNATAFALAIQSNGDIIAAGQAGSSLALSRYSSAGKLDTTFGSSGTVTTSLGSNASAISSLAIQSDGKIVAAGSIFSVGNAGFRAQAAVARYLAQ